MEKALQLAVTVAVTVWKVSKYGVISGPHFPIFGLNTEIYKTTYVKSHAKIKQYSKITYLGSEFEENLSGEAMALKVIIRLMACINSFSRNRYLTSYLK